MNKPKLMLIITLTLLVLVLIFYSFWIPSSQVFWKTMHKTNDSSILLTFDDGPGPETPIILETLSKNNITAIFFIVCNHIQEEDIPVLIEMVANGNEVGLHSKNHVVNENYASIKECKESIEEITGQQVKYYRPPYGFKTPRSMNAAQNLNMTIVLWSVFPRDYSAKSSSIIVKRVTRHLKPGDIICLHDGPEHRENTAQALQEIIANINEVKNDR
ncbi:MAG: polysaccharide deacetylase family protein [Candidatus Nanoarchaeia archaeon]